MLVGGCCDIETPRGLNRRLFTPTVASPPSNRLAHTHSSTALHEGAATALWRSSKTRQKRIQFRQSPRVFAPPIPVLISARPARPHPRDFRRRHKGIADSIFLDHAGVRLQQFPLLQRPLANVTEARRSYPHEKSRFLPINTCTCLVDKSPLCLYVLCQEHRIDRFQCADRRGSSGPLDRPGCPWAPWPLVRSAPRRRGHASWLLRDVSPRV